MPSVKVLEEKKAQVAALKEKFDGAVAGVVVDYKGISVADDTKLRKELREANVKYTVVKNTLLGFAAKNVGLDDMCGVLEGTTAIALANEDYTAAARILCKFAKTADKLEIKGGVVEGTVYDRKGIEAISAVPSREELLGKLLGSIQSPITNLARVLNQIAEQQA